MNHELRVTVYGGSQLELVEKAVARADDFYGPGNWRSDGPAHVTFSNGTIYQGTYYFTDVPLIDERTITDE